MRRPKTQRVPRTRAGGEWTEAAYWGFIRSGLRQLSRRWPPIVRGVFDRNKRPYVGPNKRQQWEYKCNGCQRWLMRKQVQADHIVPAGTLLSHDDIGPFVERLLCEVDGLQLLCDECHPRKTAG